MRRVSFSEEKHPTEKSLAARERGRRLAEYNPQLGPLPLMSVRCRHCKDTHKVIGDMALLTCWVVDGKEVACFVCPVTGKTTEGDLIQ